MERRFITPFIISLFIMIFAVSFSFIMSLSNSADDNLIPILPGNYISDLILLFIIDFGFMLLMYFIGPFGAKYLTNLHKGLKLNRYEYFVIQPEKQLTGKRIILRCFFPGFLAINIGIYIALYGEFNSLFFVDANAQGLPVTIEMTTCLIGIPIASVIIIPIWILESSGLMCSLNQEKYKNRVSPDIESVGSDFTSLIKGYIGISTVTTYIIILYKFFQTSNDIVTIIIVVFIDPFLIILMFILISLLLEYKVDDVNKRFISKIERKGIDITPQIVRIEPKD